MQKGAKETGTNLSGWEILLAERAKDAAAGGGGGFQSINRQQTKEYKALQSPHRRSLHDAACLHACTSHLLLLVIGFLFLQD
uniref:Uncharacterized protein n=1 Tax=Oryza brachyantha TaxID=4533 RepID=J3LRF6_ORYBR